MTNEKQYKTEWSFSFDKIGDRFNKMVDTFTEGEEIKQSSYQVGLEGASTGNIKLDLSLGQSSIKPLVDSDNLFEADLAYVGEIEFTTSGDVDKTVRLRQKPGVDQVVGSVRRALKSVTNRGELRWDVRLSPKVPLKLDIDGGVGPAHIDLTGLQLTRLNLDSGVGEIQLSLPDGSYQASIEGGVGATILNIAENAAARIDIEGGVGAVKINVPYKAAVRVTVDGNLGGVKMPDHFSRVKDNDDFIGRGGVWETPGFNVAEKQIVIDYEGGVGSLQVKTDATLV